MRGDLKDSQSRFQALGKKGLESYLTAAEETHCPSKDGEIAALVVYREQQ